MTTIKSLLDYIKSLPIVGGGKLGFICEKVAIVTIICLLILQQCAPDVCNKMSSRNISPDGSIVALTISCGIFGDFGVSRTSYIVHLVRPAEVEDLMRSTESCLDPDSKILELNDRPWEERPLTRWLAADRLEITAPAGPCITLHKTSYKGIKIDFSFENTPDSQQRRQLANDDKSTEEKTLDYIGSIR